MVNIESRLNKIAATLAGVTSTLRLVADNGADEAAIDSLHLLVEVTDRLNAEISEIAARGVQHA